MTVASAAVALPLASAAEARTLPDLRVSRVAPVPAAAQPGALLRVDDTVLSRGGRTAPRSTVRYYLSANGLRSAANVRLGNRGAGRLAPGRASRRALALRLPPTLAPRSYHLITCADGTRSFRESNERNNCRLSPGTLRVAAAPLIAPSPAPQPDPFSPPPAEPVTSPTPPADPPPSGDTDPPGDTTPPAVTLTSPSEGAGTKDPSPTMAGTAGTAAGDASSVTVRIYAGTAATGPPVQSQTATVSGAGSWTVDAAPILDDGTYTARAEQQDSAGNSGMSATRTFTVVPARIMAAGDAACSTSDTAYNSGAGTATRCRHLYVSDVLVGATPDAVLALGDLQYERGRLEEFQASYDPSWGRVKNVTFPAPGNHEYDDPAGGAQGYFDYFNGSGNATGRAGDRSRGYYSYDVGGWHLIALNSNCFSISGVANACTAGSAQEQWLRADLAANPAPCTLAYWHHPRFSSGAQASSTTYVPFWQALQEAGADLVLSGHAHDYERFAPMLADGTIDATNGVRSIIVGSGGKSHHPFPSSTFLPGSEAQDDDTYGALELTLRPRGYSWQFRPEAGATYSDSGSAGCH